MIPRNYVQHGHTDWTHDATLCAMLHCVSGPLVILQQQQQQTHTHTCPAESTYL